MQIFFKSRDAVRKLAKSGRIIDNGNNSPTGKRWGLELKRAVKVGP